MPTIVLVRHGVTASTGKRAGGLTDAPLTDTGRAQAAAAAERLADRGLHALYTSPVVRATQTAEVIGQRLGLEHRDLSGVRELDHGSWTEMPLKQMARTKLFDQVVRWPSRVALPDGERFTDAQARAVAGVEAVVAQHTDRRTVAIVSHADIIKLLVAHYVGMPIDAFQRLVIGPASISVLALPRAGMPRLLVFNDRSHLADG